MKTVLKQGTLALMALCLTGVAAGSLAGPAPVNDRLIVAQAQDQDPKTPPDCKKYPKDTRCKKK